MHGLILHLPRLVIEPAEPLLGAGLTERLILDRAQRRVRCRADRLEDARDLAVGREALSSVHVADARLIARLDDEAAVRDRVDVDVWAEALPELLLAVEAGDELGAEEGK